MNKKLRTVPMKKSTRPMKGRNQPRAKRQKTEPAKGKEPDIDEWAEAEADIGQNAGEHGFHPESSQGQDMRVNEQGDSEHGRDEEGVVNQAELFPAEEDLACGDAGGAVVFERNGH